MATKYTGQESVEAFDESSFSQNLMRENRIIFSIIGGFLILLTAFLIYNNNPERVKERQEQAIVQSENEKTAERLAAEAAVREETMTAEVKAKQDAKNALIYSVSTPGEASVRTSERTDTELDDLIFSMRNSAYFILNASADGKIKAGNTIEEVQAAVPNAFITLPNVTVGIFYNPANPAEFSMCGTNMTSHPSAEESVLYDARVDAFKTGIFDCSDANTNLTTPVTRMFTTPSEAPAKATLNATAQAVFAAKNVSSPVDNDGIKVNQELKKETTPTTPAPKPAEPLDIPWGVIIIAAIFLIGISVLSVIGLKIHSARDKAMESKRERDENLLKWKDVVDRHETLLKEWASYELDPVRILDLPLMSDMREPNTIEFHKAMRTAKYLKPTDLKSASYKSPFQSDYANAVDALDNAFHIAEVEAKRVRWNKFSNGERKRLQTAKNLLSLAMNSAATDSERQSAYKRMQKELEGLIVMPKATVLALEKKVNLMLTDGSEDKETLSLAK